jgi:hypothetical protein
MPFVRTTYRADADLPDEDVRAYLVGIRTALGEVLGSRSQQVRAVIERLPASRALDGATDPGDPGVQPRTRTEGLA